MIVNSNFKGYHVFKIRTHAQFPMIIEKEIGNTRDSCAIIIKMPRLKEITENSHQDITKKNRKRKELKS